MDLAALLSTFGKVAKAAEPLLQSAGDAQASQQARTPAAQSSLVPGQLGSTLSHDIGRASSFAPATDPAVQQILDRIGEIEKAVGVKKQETEAETEAGTGKKAEETPAKEEKEESFSLDTLLDLLRRMK